MKKITLIFSAIIFTCRFGMIQEQPESNGFNLDRYCGEPCRYITYQTYYFPYEHNKEWEIYNMEIAIKESGDFLITGDLNVLGSDNAITLELTFLFIDESNQIIHTTNSKRFEFFSESGQADPFVFTGNVSEEIAAKMHTVDFGVEFYERVPYYTISSNCFRPCKNLELKESIKTFRKK